MKIEEIKDKLGEEKERYSDNLDRTFDDLLGKLVFYGYLKQEDCNFIDEYRIEAFEEDN